MIALIRVPAGTRAIEVNVNKFTGIPLLVALSCASANAQQQTRQSNETAPSSIRARLLNEIDQTLSPAPGFKLAAQFPPVGELSQAGTSEVDKHPAERDRQTLEIRPTPWVWKDGALYMDIGVFGSAMLIPLPGGGASGCFGPIQPERIDKLRTSIERFPVRPPSPAPPRQ